MSWLTPQRDFARRLTKPGWRWQLQVPEAPGLWVSADPDRLAQVLANLIENALKFADRRIRISADRAGDTVVVAVEDDGRAYLPTTWPRSSTGSTNRRDLRLARSGRDWAWPS